MKAKRVDCMCCLHLKTEEGHNKFKYWCDLGKRVMFRKPFSPYANTFLFPRYCNDFKDDTENIIEKI